MHPLNRPHHIPMPALLEQRDKVTALLAESTQHAKLISMSPFSLVYSLWADKEAAPEHVAILAEQLAMIFHMEGFTLIPKWSNLTPTPVMYLTIPFNLTCQ